MQARELYARYRVHIKALADGPKPLDAWLPELHELLREFEADAATLEPLSARLLRDELCEQFEHEALHAAADHRRDVLFAAVKGLEQSAPPPMGR